MNKGLRKIYSKVKNKVWLLPTTLMLMQSKVFAADGSISTAEVNQATENIKNAVIKLAMPIGGILVFVSIVIIAIKMIVNSNVIFDYKCNISRNIIPSYTYFSKNNYLFKYGICIYSICIFKDRKYICR